jgi:hypothetical protein
MSFTTTIGIGPLPAFSTCSRMLPRPGAYGESSGVFTRPHWTVSQAGSGGWASRAVSWSLQLFHRTEEFGRSSSSGTGTGVAEVGCGALSPGPSMTTISGRLEGPAVHPVSSASEAVSSNAAPRRHRTVTPRRHLLEPFGA